MSAPTAGDVKTETFRPADPWYKPPTIAVDCLYNSSRSVVITMVTFAFVVTCSTTLIVFSLQTSELTTTEIAFATQPPTTSYFGLPISNFSVSVLHQPLQKGLPGVKVSIRMIALTAFSLSGSIPPTQVGFTIQDVDCLGAVYGLNPIDASLSKSLCDTTLQLQSADALTDDNGIATFRGLTLAHGYPTKYMMIVTHNAPMESTDPTPREITSVVTMRSFDSYLDAPDVRRLATAPGALATFRVTGAIFLDFTNFAQDLLDTASAISTAGNTGQGDFSTSGSQQSSYYGSDLPPPSPPPSPTPAPPSDADILKAQLGQQVNITAIIIPLNLQGIVSRDSSGNDLIVGSSGIRRAMLSDLSEYTSRLNNITFVFGFAAVATYDITFSVKSTTLRVGYFGLYVLGSIMPLMPSLTEFGVPADPDLNNRYPSYQVMPFPIVTPLSNGAVSVSMTVVGSSTITPNGTITLTLTLSAPAVTAKKVYLFFHAGVHSGSKSGYGVLKSADSNSFRLVNPLITVAAGATTVTAVTALSASGVSGDYELSAVVDGYATAVTIITVASDVDPILSSIALTTDALTAAKPSASKSTPSVAFASIGVAWPVTPTAIALNSAKVPIPGRLGVLRARDSQIELVFLSTPSDSDGLLKFWFVMATRVPSNLVQQPVGIDVIIDGVLVDTFVAVFSDSADVISVTATTAAPVTVQAAGAPLNMNLSLVDQHNHQIAFESLSIQVTLGDGASFGYQGSVTLLSSLVFTTGSDGIVDLNALGISIFGVPELQYVTMYMQYLDFASVPADGIYTDLSTHVGDTTGFQSISGAITPIAIVRLPVDVRVSNMDADNRLVRCTANGVTACSASFSIQGSDAANAFTQPNLIAGSPSYQLFYRSNPTPQVSFAVSQHTSTAVAWGFTFDPAIEGYFLVSPLVDGVSFVEAFVIIKVTSNVANIAITTGSGWTRDADVKTGMLSTTPQLRIINTDGTGAALAVAYVRLSFGGGIPAADIASGNFEHGAFSRNLGASVLPLPLSTVADAQGVVTFPNLNLIGITPGMPFAVQYCVGESVCVSEPAVVKYTGRKAGVRVEDAPQNAAPGALIPTMTATVDHAPAFVKLLITSKTVFPVALSGPQYLSSAGTVVTMKGLRLPATTTDGFYTMQVVAPGAVSDPFQVTISSDVTGMQVVDGVPSTILLGTTFYPRVYVQSNGIPLAGVPVTATSSAKNCNPSTDSCGTLTGSLTVLTDKNGIAGFEVQYLIAATGTYWLSFTVATSGQNGAAAFLSATAKAATSFLGTRVSFAGLPKSVLDSLKVVKGLLDSVLPAQGSFDVSSSKVQVYNPVASIVVVRHPALKVPSTELPKGLDQQPIVRLFGLDGLPVQNRSVEVTTGNNCDVAGSSPPSDINGTIRFTDLRVTQGSPGSCGLVFNSKGTRSTAASGISIQAVEPPAMSEKMKIISFAVIALLMPLLIANIPHSTWRWLPLSLVSLAIVAGVAIYSFAQYLDTDVNAYIRAYMFLMLVLYSGMCLAVAVMMIMRLRKLASSSPKNAGQGVEIDDESRSLQYFKYTTWFINARRDMKYGYGEHRAFLNSQRKASIKFKIQEFLNSKGLKSVTLVEMIKMTEDVNLPELECPKDCDVYFTPLKFWIVIAISLVLLALLVLFSLWAVGTLRDFLVDLYNNLPQPPPSTVADFGNWQQETKKSLQQLVLFAATNVPQLNFITKVMDPLTKYNFLSYLASFVSALAQVIDGLTAGLVVGHIFAFSAVIAVGIVMYVRMPIVMKKMRRGELRAIQAKSTLDSADGYIGVHCVLFVAQHQMVFWVMLTVATLLSCQFVWDFLWTKIGISLLISIAINQLNGIIEETIISTFVRDKMDVHRPLLNSLWSIVAAVLGVFKGLIGAVVRIVMAVALMIFCAPVLEFSILPGPLAEIDSGYKAFYSMIAADNAYNNPIMITFIAILVVDTQLIKAARRDTTQPSDQHELFDRLSFSSQNGVPSVVNVARHRFNFLLAHSQKAKFGSPGFTGGTTGARVLASACELVSVRYARIACRWWLLYLLHRNPSIRKWRKWRIRAENNVAPLEKKKDDDATKRPAAARNAGNKENDVFEELLPKTSASPAASPSSRVDPFDDLLEPSSPPPAPPARSRDPLTGSDPENSSKAPPSRFQKHAAVYDSL